jgi:transcriptional activator of cad operon
MTSVNGKPLRVGDWLVDPRAGQISRSGEIVRLDARAMRLLMHLAARAGEVVSIDELLREVWAGVVVTPDSVYQAVASLRRLLGDDSKQPKYIANVPRLGYRMVATVAPASEEPRLAVEATPVPAPKPRRWTAHLAATLVTLGVLLSLGAVLWQVTPLGRAPSDGAMVAQPEHSIAVMPFFDLTEEMNQEPFVDGMTEELVEKLSNIPDVRVPPARSTFKFKGTGATIADIAEALNVAYVLDGSVRRSGDMLRVAARLVRADDGYVAWSQTYDRPMDDMIMIQDDIAAEVAKSLRQRVTSETGS